MASHYHKHHWGSFCHGLGNRGGGRKSPGEPDLLVPHPGRDLGDEKCPQVSWEEEVAVAHPLLEPLGDDLGAALAAWKAAVNHRQAEKQSFLYKT